MTDITDREASIIREVARAVTRKWPRVECDDLVQDLWVWALENVEWVRRYRDAAEPYGESKLRKALYRAGLKFAAKEEAVVTGRYRLNDEDRHCYGREQVKALLKYVWSPDDWPHPKTPQHPVTGYVYTNNDIDRVNDALTMLMDVANAINRLSLRDQKLLRLRYYEDLPAESLADSLGMTTDAVYKAIERAVSRLQSML